MARIITEQMIYTQERLEAFAKWAAQAEIVGHFYVGDIHEQTAEWQPDGSLIVVTKRPNVLTEDTPQTQPWPDCMLLDGAEPCAGFSFEANQRAEWQRRFDAQAAEYKLARERLMVLADEAIRREAEFKALADLMDVADCALDKDTYDQKSRDDFDAPDDAEWFIQAGTERKISKVFAEIDRIRRSIAGGVENSL